MPIRWMLVVLLCGAVAATTPRAQQRIVSEGRTTERVAGLLNLPEVFGDALCERFQSKTIPFYTEPAKEQPPAGSIEARVPQQANPECFQPHVIVQQAGSNSAGQELPTEESGYEVQAAVVYERSENWFRVAFQQGSGWIERDNPADFLAYPSGLTDHLTYLRSGWDGKIWPAPGQGPGENAPRNWMVRRNQNLPIRLVSIRIVNGEVWIQLQFETGEVCGEKLNNVTPLEGWLPAYRPEGTTSVWFYSRGC